MTEEMASIRNRIDIATKEYNSKCFSNAPINEITKIDESIREDVKKFNDLSMDEAFATCKQATDPMLEAVKLLDYPTLRVQDKKDKDSGLSTRFVLDSSKPIDPLLLSKTTKNGIGHDPLWNAAIEQFNCQMTARVVKDLGGDPKTVDDSYYMSKLARKYDLGENPCSNTQLMKTMTTIVSSMIGDDYHPIKKDENYLLMIYARKDNREHHKVTTASHRQMRLYMMEICNRIVTGKVYGANYKIVKKK